MSSTAEIPTHTTVGLPSQASSYGDSPPEGTYRKTSGGVRKRASRAGTRSVTTLSAAQLERKRANDREAQRAIRQRTKDHIDGLEKALNDIKQTLETREKLLTAAHQRNRELEDENQVLKLRLNDHNIPTAIAKYSRPGETIASAPPSAVSEASGSISHRSGSISHGYPLNNGALTTPINGSWQQQQTGFTPANAPLMLSTNVESRNMTGWRARDSPQAMSATTGSNLQGLHPPQTIPYTPNGTSDRAWSTQYGFTQPAQNFSQQNTQQADNHFNQNSNPNFQQAQQPQNFHPPLLPPQNDFNQIANQAFYQFTPQGQGYTGQTQYQTGEQVQTSGTNFSATQPSPVSAYHNDDTAFNQQIHPPMLFRDDAETRGYSMSQFAPG